MKPNDYKDYVYLRIPKKEYEDIIKNKKQINYIDLESWYNNYKWKNFKKKISAQWANKQKKKQVLEKIFIALNNYYNGLFKEEKKSLTSYKLAKLAGINYLTARKYWEEGWKEKFEKNPINALKELKGILKTF